MAVDHALALRLDGLGVMRSAAPDAQRQSVALELEAPGIEIGRDLRRRRGRAVDPAQQWHLLQLLRPCGRQFQLDLNLFVGVMERGHAPDCIRPLATGERGGGRENKYQATEPRSATRPSARAVSS